MRRLTLTAMAAVTLAVPTVLAASPAAAAPTLDRTDKGAVAVAYQDFLPSLDVTPQWTGDTTRCVSGQHDMQPAAAIGTQSEASRQATFAAINFYRDMAGLQPVKERPGASAIALQAALIMQESRALSHDPGRDWPCYSLQGAYGASTSNLAIQSPWPKAEAAPGRAMAMYMDDFGPANQHVGHRRWLLYPPASEFGTGSTATANALKVISEKQDNPRPSGATTWPSAGYFPWEIMPTSNRWSYSLARTGEPSFANATVSVTLRGAPIAATVVARDGLFGDPALVWEVTGLNPPQTGEVDTYTVRIAGVTRGPSNTPVPAVEYQVKAFKAACTFGDVPPGLAFHREICWLSAMGISRGYEDGTFRPVQPVNRDAMAAFMYRLAGSPAFDPKGRRTFTDVSPSTPFYKEIEWLASTGISTGWVTPHGRRFHPYAPVNRDAMAAFLYRLHGSPSYTPPATSPFTDVRPSTQFYKEMSWLAAHGISTGWPVGGGAEFRPVTPVNRDAMAAFMYRGHQKWGTPTP
ncbi:MAG: S-layer homology domain-containing protein [Propioniciclava sp.]|uniref:S-layer homology domain-containing protein n=1 Tax=Propioniciclava sp. TaxID=2038686 RepID=UPI0039E6D968